MRYYANSMPSFLQYIGDLVVQNYRCELISVFSSVSGILYLGLVFKTVSFLVSILAFIFYKPPPPQPDDTVVMEVTMTDTYTEANSIVLQSPATKANSTGTKENATDADLNRTTYSGTIGDITENDIDRTTETSTDTRLHDSHLGTESTNVKSTPANTATTSFTNTAFATEADGVLSTQL